MDAPKPMTEAECLSAIIANEAYDRYRFTGASSVRVATTAVHEVLKDLMPLMPWFHELLERDDLPVHRHNQLAELVDTLKR